MIQHMFNLFVDKIMIKRCVFLLNGGQHWFVFDDPCDVISCCVISILEEVLNCSRKVVGEMGVSTFIMQRKGTVGNKTLGLEVCIERLWCNHMPT